MQRPAHIFFDLDHTLWDFEENARETLREILTEFTPRMERTPDFEMFYRIYFGINERLWKLYRENHIDSFRLRYIRFRETFRRMEMRWGPWIDSFGEAYLDRCPQKPHLIPGARNLLDTLHGRSRMHLITNGFTHVQDTKMASSGIRHYFDVVATSDNSGHKKPDRRIFDYAVAQTGADPAVSPYVGDNYEADVEGGLKAGFYVIFFNPGNQPNPLGVPEIRHLSELAPLLGY